MESWWKCKWIGEIKGPVSFKRGQILFAKNEGKTILFFDGGKGARLPKTAMKDFQLVSRLDKEEAASNRNDALGWPEGEMNNSHRIILGNPGLPCQPAALPGYGNG